MMARRSVKAVLNVMEPPMALRVLICEMKEAVSMFYVQVLVRQNQHLSVHSVCAHVYV